MNILELVTSLELLMIELAYAAGDMRVAQEESKGSADCKLIQQACAKIAAARQAVEIAKELVDGTAARPEMRFAS